MFGLLAAGMVAGVGTLSCVDPEARRAREAEESRARIATESARATATTDVASAGVWTDALLVKRLVDAGLAPQRRDSVRAQPWMGVPVHPYRLGASSIDAYIFADSTARLARLALLDRVTLAPAGQASPWGASHDLIENGNLLAIVVGGTDRQRDRIATALAAGVGAP